MLESNNPHVDINEILEKVGLELRLYQKSEEKKEVDADEEPLNLNDPYAWGQINDTLHIAEQNANAGAEVTSMLHYRGFIRKIAKVLGKVVIYLGRVITIPQRNFNAAILHCFRITLDGIRDMNRDSAVMQQQIRKLDKRITESDQKLSDAGAVIDYLKSNLITQERRVSLLLEELRKQVSHNKPLSSEAIDTDKIPDIQDPLYLAFENEFRGTRDEIRQRLLEYVPLIKKCGSGDEGRVVLDIGCGRGEWLEIMKNEGLAARGVDLNDVLVEQCQERGFDVVKQDALAYLRTLPDQSVGAITSFHLIEHLDLDVRLALFDECLRVLQSGGVALFETPNPRNLLVGSCNFWADPTHLKPLYPETHQFLLEYRGFCNVDLLFLHPHEENQRLPEEEAPQLAARLNEVFSCARDYTIIGYKV